MTLLSDLSLVSHIGVNEWFSKIFTLSSPIAQPGLDETP